MKRLGLALISCIALVAFMGFSAQAWGVANSLDPSCDLDHPDWGDFIPGPYNNDAVVHDFTIKTPGSQVEHAVSAVEGSGLACGTQWTLLSQSTYYDNIDVTNPPGVVINDTSTMPVTGFVGTAKINVMNSVLKVVQNQVGTMRIAPIAECAAEAPVGGPNPGDIISCQKSTFSGVGYNYNWTNVDTSTSPPTYRLTIGPSHTAGISGPTHIKQFNLCGRVGAAGTGDGSYPADCGGNTAPWLQRNGDGSYPNCAGGKGVYTASATMRSGFTTPAVTKCVLWVGKSEHPSDPQ